MPCLLFKAGERATLVTTRVIRFLKAYLNDTGSHRSNVFDGEVPALGGELLETQPILLGYSELRHQVRVGRIYNVDLLTTAPCQY